MAMICPICHYGELEEHDFSTELGICNNLGCGAIFTQKGEIVKDKRRMKK